GVPHRRNDRPARLVDVAHHTAPHARVFREPHAQHFRERQPRQLAHHLCDHGARLGAAEIEPGYDLAIPAHAPSPPPLAVRPPCPRRPRSGGPRPPRAGSTRSGRPAASTATRPLPDPRGAGTSAAGSTSRTSTESTAGSRRTTRASATPASPRSRSARSRVSPNTLARGPSRNAAITASGARLRTPTSS